MAMIVWAVSLIAGLYGLGYLVFAFVEPPAALSRYFGAPTAFYFLPEMAGRIVMGLACIALAVVASTVIPMMWG